MRSASSFSALTPATGTTPTAFGESYSVPAASPYTVPVTNSTNFVADQGVIYSASGLPLKQVASGPAQGQYSVAAGVYTFAAADTGAGVLISYTYNATSSGESVAVNQALIGPPTMVFSANLFASDPTNGNQFSVWLYNCLASKLSFGTKLEDFVMPEFDFDIFANAAGQVIKFNFGDAA